jgi:predicted chitinase/chitodextrinase
MRRLVYTTLLIAVLLSLVLVVPAGAAPAQADRGPWAPNTAYAVNDTVTYGGSTYKCLQAHTSITTWEPPNTPALWQLTAGGGATATRTRTPTAGGPTATRTRTPIPGGPTATRTRTSTPGAATATRTRTPTAGPTSGSGCWPAWVSTTAYSGGAQVSRSGRNYQANYWTQGNDPATNSGPVGTGQPWIPMSFCGAGNATSTPGGTGFASIVSNAQFDQMFPSRNSFYTYQGLVTAANFYSAFAGTGTTDTRKREAAAALANFAHETGGLWYITEIAQGLYCDAGNTQYPCAAGKRYYGRGPIQLSWNFNYGAAGAALGLPLLTNPDLVEQDSATAWKTALWYWMTQNGPGTMTAHNAMVNGAGFGETIRSINGALECNGGNGAQVQSRINNYNNFISILGTTAGPGNLGC